MMKRAKPSVLLALLALLVAVELTRGGVTVHAQSDTAAPPPEAAGLRLRLPKDWSPKRDAATDLAGRRIVGTETPETHEWTQGVSEDEQQQATFYFDRGNALLRDNRFLDARHEYNSALKHWDHPTIHYNYALATIPLAQPLDVYNELVKATHYGAASFADDPVKSDELFRTAQRHLKQALDALVSIEIACDEKDAVVSIDGKSMFVAPNKITKLLMPGNHLLMATKAQYVDDRRNVTLVPGTYRFTLRPYKRSELTFERDRWSVWLPLTTALGGAVIGGVGAWLAVDANDTIKAYDTAVGSCAGTGGQDCTASKSRQPKSERSDAITWRAIGWAGIIGGAAAFSTGLVLLYANRPQEYVITPEERERRTGITVSLLPDIAPTQAAITAYGTF